MRAGNFEADWRHTDRIEMIRRQRGWRDESAGDLLWDGTPFEGRTVLVRCLHGLGDTLQYARFVRQVCRVAARVYFAVQPSLLRLFRTQSEFGTVIDGWITPFP